MAVTILGMARISMTSADAGSLARFYEAGLGFKAIGQERRDATPYGMAGSDALVITLGLGDQQIELVQFDEPGAPYPPVHSSHDPWFQHIAIVVRDIDAAFRHLQERTQPTMISRGGPVTLPAAAGGVRAVKLRDPERHPFELLQFPSGGTPGIDHSAIVVAETARSIAFYESLGLSVTSRSLNQGPEQELLDAAPHALVEVTGLSPRQATPHVELLCYNAPPSAPPQPVAPNDIAATRLVMHTDQPPASSPLFDPDGHRLMLV